MPRIGATASIAIIEKAEKRGTGNELIRVDFKLIPEVGQIGG